MSAPENKISNNRRRLFKALSTAPVVMTLKPGAAFATASAYQCVVNMNTPTNLYYPHTNAVCDGVDCFVYQERNFWDVSGCGYAGSPAIVVETSTGVYFAGSGEQVYPTINLSHELEKFVLGVHTFTCSPKPIQKVGLFLAVGAGNSPTAPTEFDFKGVYPEYQLVGQGNQGMTGTCLGSIPNNLTGSYTLAKG